MLKHKTVTQSRAADVETQRRQPKPTMLKHKGSRYSQRSTSTKSDIVKSVIHVAETACELRC
jgi:hypothetical protein